MLKNQLMNKRKNPIMNVNFQRQIYLLLIFCFISLNCLSTYSDTIPPQHRVTLKEAHIGDREIDTKLLDSYELLPENIRQFYLQAREFFSGNSTADFNHPEILKAATKNDVMLMGGPLLGNLEMNRVIIWMRPSTSLPIVVKVKEISDGDEKLFVEKSVVPGKELQFILDGLAPDSKYSYTIEINRKEVAEGSFKTAPNSDAEGEFKLAFGSCFHKIGLHNPNLINQILSREPIAMMLLGDIAVDDRENQINMHRSDYQLRDVSKAWKNLAANVPLYTSWDDHDYFNNDLSGVPKGFIEADREAVRKVWQQNWNNPKNDQEGIYFNTQIGPVEIIMLDTRSLRQNNNRGKYGAYLGADQLKWLKKILKNSDAPFKVISSGTMWSDYITPGKDSWGTWDTLAREEMFSFIEAEKIAGVLLVSGDRHGARGFTIPRPSGFAFYEFEAASLGGVPGPDAMAKDTTYQLFGYHGNDEVAFGEFAFSTAKPNLQVTFRLINQYGKILEEHLITYDKLSP